MERLGEVERIFHEALERPHGTRRRWLEQRCAGDPRLLEAVVRLLRHHDEDEGWASLDGAIHGALDEALGEQDPGDRPRPERVGRYRILDELGRGGMGRVFLAEREDVGRRVALKVVQGALASPERVRRFEVEQRVLARLEHPNIAQLIDAGVTDDGTPFFVMERVDGVPITAWVERTDASLERCLEVVLRICDAVAYAHRNLVVHRDIKPANVLVTAGGDPKLLDFGVAKLLDEAGEDGLTGTATRVFTPTYASPEQLAGEPVTTATDVYQLGVLLYEVLAGTAPFDVSSLGPAEALRVVTSDDPPPPSRAPARPEPRGASTAAATSRTHMRLKRRSRGDLDRIVLACLEKEPTRRYASVEALAQDLRRYLDGHPIEARPGGMLYRAGKFVRRHRVLSAACLAGVLWAGTVSLQNRAIARESERAEREAESARRVSDFLVELFALADPRTAATDSVSVLGLVEAAAERADEELADEPEIRASVQEALGRVHLELGRHDDADTLLAEALRLRRAAFGDDAVEVAAAMYQLGRVAWAKGELDRADSLNRRVLAIQERELGRSSPEFLMTLQNQGTVRYAQGRYDEAESLLAEAVALAREVHGDQPHQDVSIALNNLANAIWGAGRRDEARAVMREGLAVDRALYPGDHPDIALRLDNLAFMAATSGDWDEALRMGQEALDMYDRVYVEPNPNTGFALRTVADASFALGDTARADSLHLAGIDLHETLLGPEHPDAVSARAAYAAFLHRAGRTDEAESWFEAAVEETARVLGTEHPRYAQLLGSLADVVAERGDAARALELRGEAWERGRAALGEEHPWVIEAGGRLAGDLRAAGDSAAAAEVDAQLPDPGEGG
jgi:serine/threonine-protein kinase